MDPARIKEIINFAPLRIAACFGDQELAKGTGFHYSHPIGEYLITCWHNVTGREPDSRRCKSPTGGIPDRLKIGLPIKLKSFQVEGKGEASTYGWKDAFCPLYEGDQHEKALWYEHPAHRAKVDVVAIRIDNLKATGSEARFINEPAMISSEPELFPGMDVFVLGFPMGMTAGGRLPIWKRGSLATEPDIDLDGLPKLYIDTATREGMSGAPVIASTSGVWWPEPEGPRTEEHLRAHMRFGSVDRFIGVYSGRVGDDTFLAQLGIVWKESVIAEIIEGQVRGTSSFLL